MAWDRKLYCSEFSELFRKNGENPRAREMSYLEGPSTANQIIEYFWNFLRGECTDFWICLARHLEENGLLDGGYFGLLQYCFMHLVQVYSLNSFSTLQPISFYNTLKVIQNVCSTCRLHGLDYFIFYFLYPRTKKGMISMIQMG